MTNAEARFNNFLCPRKPEGSLGRTAQDGHLDSHTAPELWYSLLYFTACLYSAGIHYGTLHQSLVMTNRWPIFLSFSVFIAAGPAGNCAGQNWQLKDRERIWKKKTPPKKDSEWTGKLENGTKKNSWQRANHAWLYSDLLQALKVDHLSANGSQQKGP